MDGNAVKTNKHISPETVFTFSNLPFYINVSNKLLKIANEVVNLRKLILLKVQ